jgi:hypothetical protein
MFLGKIGKEPLHLGPQISALSPLEHLKLVSLVNRTASPYGLWPISTAAYLTPTHLPCLTATWAPRVSPNLHVPLSPSY